MHSNIICQGIGISIILAQLLSGPPTSFDPAQLGYIYTAPFIGALLSYFIGGLFSDKIAKFMARRNNNVYEPEFRILLVIPTMLAAIPGLFAFGDSAQRHLHWIVLSVCYGLITFGVVMSCTATFSYVLDAHRDVSVEMMVSILVVKNFFCFGTTFFISDWLAEVVSRCIPRTRMWPRPAANRFILLIRDRGRCFTPLAASNSACACCRELCTCVESCRGISCIDTIC